MSSTRIPFDKYRASLAKRFRNHSSPTMTFNTWNEPIMCGSNSKDITDENLCTVELKTLLDPDSPPPSYSPHQSQKYVKWGVEWRKHPTFMITYALLGLGFALGHHFYYSHLCHKIAGSVHRQQWAHAFGNILAVLVVVLLRQANRVAYEQFIWNLVRQNSFKLGTLDKFFSLTSNLTGFFSWEILTNAPLAVYLGFVCWALAIAGFLPPGSLTVIPGSSQHSDIISMPRLNWSASHWSESNNLPTTLVQRLATMCAEGMQICDFTPIYSNSSYSMEVQGPFWKCEKGNSSQAPIFDYYRQALWDETITTNSTYLASTDSMPDLVISAFEPFLSEGIIVIPANVIGLMNAITPNVTLPPSFTDSTGYIPDVARGIPECIDQGSINSDCQMFPRQLWITTSNENLVCTLYDGIRTVFFNFTGNSQAISYGELRKFQPIFLPMPDSLSIPDLNISMEYASSYSAVYKAMVSILSGWVLIIQDGSGTFTKGDETSQIGMTGLDACEEFQNNGWEPDNSTIFTKPRYMCRKNNLARAIEDLSANITISMLTESNLTSPNMTNVTVTSYRDSNIYKYNPFLLVVSYCSALAATFLGVCLGLYAFKQNGVSHSSAFSAIVATTRNPDLDRLSEGHSLGAFPLDKQVAEVKLKFGGIDIGEKGIRAGFGVAEKVHELVKGGSYI